MKKISFALGFFAVLFVAINVQAQNTKTDLNKYKYVIIPMQFSFQNEDNQYMINSKLKYLLNQQGFETYMDVEDGPEDMELNSCLALHADLKSEAEGFMAMQTKLILQLKDCRNRVVFESEEGTSREKDFKKGYQEALDDIFNNSFYDINYKYNGEVIEEKDQLVNSSKSETQPSAPQKEVQVAKGLAITKDRVYTYENKTYGVHKIEAGYLLLDEKTGDRKALLHETDEGNILYNSTTVNGTASIKEGGKLIKVEYFDVDGGGVKTMLFTEKE